MILAHMTISVTILVLFMLLIRRVGKHQLTGNLMLGMWHLILIRVMIPIRFSLNLIPFISAKTSVVIPKALGVTSAFSTVAKEHLYHTEVLARSVLFIGENFFLLWETGAFFVFIFHVIGYLRQRRRTMDFIPSRNKVADVLIKEAGLRRIVRYYTNTRRQEEIVLYRYDIIGNRFNFNHAADAANWKESIVMEYDIKNVGFGSAQIADSFSNVFRLYFVSGIE